MLRTHLPFAAHQDRGRFAGAGTYLFESDGITPEGRCIFASIERTRRFGRYIKRHAPRLSSSEDERLFLLEKAIRIFCVLDLRGAEVDARLLAQIAEAFTALRPGEPLQKLADFIPDAKPHAHPGLRFYEDYRRYLLRYPLKSNTPDCTEVAIVQRITPIIFQASAPQASQNSLGICSSCFS